MGAWSARQIWRSLDRPTREAMALFLWEDGRLSRVERLQALTAWLTARGLRAAYLEKLPRSRRASLMAQGGVPEETASQLLMSFHLQHRRELLGSFLDALGIAHENGMIDEDVDFQAPDRDAVVRATETLREKYPGEQVDLYLRTLTSADPLTWAAVAEVIDDPE